MKVIRHLIDKQPPESNDNSFLRDLEMKSDSLRASALAISGNLPRDLDWRRVDDPYPNSKGNRMFQLGPYVSR